MTEHVIHAPDHRLERLVLFSDGVFAIAITLLIIEVHVPHLEANATNEEWQAALLGLLPSFGAFALSFLVVGAMWIRHHALLSMVTRFDPVIMWPNLLLLMSVAFLPFSTALLSIGSLSPLPYAFYDASLLLAALLKLLLAFLVLKPSLVAKGVTEAQMRAERRRNAIMPIVTLIALALAFVAPAFNNFAMLLLPLMRLLPFFAVADRPHHPVSKPAARPANRRL